METVTGSARTHRRTWLLIPAMVLALAVAVLLVKPWSRSPSSGRLASSGAIADTSAAASGDTAGKAKDAPEESKVVPVEVASVIRDSVSATYTASATLEAERHVDLLAKIEGRVEGIQVEEGDDVASGAILAVLDARELRIQVDKARSSLENAKAEYERVKALATEDLASQKALEEAEHALELARAALDEAELKLSYTEIRAPFAGRVTRRLIEIGQTVSPGQQVFSLADLDPLLVRVYLPEDEIIHIHPRQDVAIRLDAASDLKLSGRVQRIAPMVDRQTGTVKVTVEVGQGQGRELRPGSFARVYITTDIHPQALVLPKRCLVEEAGKRYVFLLQGDSVVVRDVELGYEEADRVEVTGGLEEGDLVVKVGQGSLKEGMLVRVLGDDVPAGDEGAAAGVDTTAGS